MDAPLLRSILAATDLSEASDGVLRAAGRLAAATGAALHVVHAFDFPETPYAPQLPGAPMGVADLHTFPARVREAEEALAAQCARALPEGPAPASRDVQIYTAHRAILDRAEAVGADLVVLGPHRRRAMDALLGTTADRVLRMAAVPCLVMRGELGLPLERVVAPFDLSEPSRGALDAAVAWCAVLGRRDGEWGLPAVELRVVHVIPKFLLSPDLPFDRAAVGPRLHAAVEGALGGRAGGGGIGVEEELLFGDGAAETITGFAAAEEAGLIVMGTHGHGAVKRLLLGGVASGVARAAPCPVLLVPPPRGAGADVEDSGAQAGGRRV